MTADQKRMEKWLADNREKYVAACANIEKLDERWVELERETALSRQIKERFEACERLYNAALAAAST